MERKSTKLSKENNIDKGHNCNKMLLFSYWILRIGMPEFTGLTIQKLNILLNNPQFETKKILPTKYKKIPQFFTTAVNRKQSKSTKPNENPQIRTTTQSTWCKVSAKSEL